MSMSTQELNLDDPVHVDKKDEGEPLEGIVAFLGKVEFSNDEDWVGIRLTGSSAGINKGKNDGSVKGKRYFNCPKGDGMFVHAPNVKKRVLSRLEELRLKRELRTTGIATTTTTTTKTPTKTPMKSATAATPGGVATPGAAPDTAVKSPTATKTRLEEIRARREALAAGKSASSLGGSSGASTPAKGLSPSPSVDRDLSTTPSAVASTTSSEEVRKLNATIQTLTTKVGSLDTQISELSTKLQSKEEENSKLQQSLSQTEQDLHELRKENDNNVERVKTLEEEKQNVVTQPSPEKSSASTASLESSICELKDELTKVKDELFTAIADKNDLQDRFEQQEQVVKTLKTEVENERDGRAEDAKELTDAKSKVLVLQQEMQAIMDTNENRNTSNTQYIKQQAKLQAELNAFKNQLAQLKDEKLDLETTLEDLTLDKEQLTEEKETLQDKMEEMLLDNETYQMEIEEIKMELEDAKSSNAAAVSDGTASSAPPAEGKAADADDVAQALSIQNSRLREALIKLREQSQLEKMDLQRELRKAEKESTKVQSLTDKVDTLSANNKKQTEEINDLKEMVEQNSAFESMVEDLSDRVMSLEDENVTLQSTIRELEDAADITAEMEEVQTDENRALTRDLEVKDSIIRNLEEAIRMQRRREDDYHRTVSNYRNSIETLKTEKNALLEMQKGAEGTASDLVQSTQKALARAAQLVSEGAENRKKDVIASFNLIDCAAQKHYSSRLEQIIPMSVDENISNEITSMKGEVLLSKITNKASLSLNELSSIFNKKIKYGINETVSVEETKEGAEALSAVTMSDESKQAVESMIYQCQYTNTIIDVGSDLLRFLCAGQWPDVLTTNESIELGSIMSQSGVLLDLDVVLSDILKTLKEEADGLSPHLNNINTFKQTIQGTFTELYATHLTNPITGKLLLSKDWMPPAFMLFKTISTAKFTCLGAAAIVASAMTSSDDEVKKILKSLMLKLDQACTESTKACQRLTKLNITDDKVVDALSSVANEWSSVSSTLFESVTAALSYEGNQIGIESVSKCQVDSDNVLRSIAQYSAALRNANLVTDETSESSGEYLYHALSPEAHDPWGGISNLSRAVRSIDGDNEDVNFLLRSTTIEKQLSTAVSNTPKLVTANTKIATLEKSLNSRMTEIAMQNARLLELEKLLAKTSARPSAVSSKINKKELKSTEETISKLQNENRVLTEAMDVLQSQVDEYESEIRALTTKTPAKGRRMASAITPAGKGRNTVAATPRRLSSNVADYGASATGRATISGGKLDFSDLIGGAGSSGGGPSATTTELEAALFRPALQSALNETAAWKSKAIASSMWNLPPLDVPGVSPPIYQTTEPAKNGSEEEKCMDSQDLQNEASYYAMKLSTAQCRARLAKASLSVTRLSGDEDTARQNLRASIVKQRESDKLLQAATDQANAFLSRITQQQGVSSNVDPNKIIAKVTIAGSPFDDTRQDATSSISCKKDDVSRWIQMLSY